ncbi:lysozyme, partial [Escherichia coli EC1856]
RWR